MSTAVLLLNLGGPSTLAEVEPFLSELFNDILPSSLPPRLRKIFSVLLAKARSPVSKKYYRKIGGGSPLRQLSLLQAQNLETKLTTTRVRVVMRYSPPRARDVLANILREGVKKIVLLPLYPQFSRATTKSSVNEILELVARIDDLEVELIPSWFSYSPFVQFSVDWIENYLRMENLSKENTFFLFSAHSLPRKWINEGDPYLRQTEANVSQLVERLQLSSSQFVLGFQSKVGRAGWLEPTNELCLRHLGEKTVWKNILIVPTSFVSDHVETLYELDIYLREVAAKWGRLRVYRLPMFNTAPEFIDVLRDIVLTAPRWRRGLSPDIPDEIM